MPGGGENQRPHAERTRRIPFRRGMSQQSSFLTANDSGGSSELVTDSPRHRKGPAELNGNGNRSSSLSGSFGLRRPGIHPTLSQETYTSSSSSNTLQPSIHSSLDRPHGSGAGLSPTSMSEGLDISGVGLAAGAPAPQGVSDSDHRAQGQTKSQYETFGRLPESPSYATIAPGNKHEIVPWAFANNHDPAHEQHATVSSLAWVQCLTTSNMQG